MVFSSVGDSIDVLVAFRKNRPEPMVIKWNNRHYQVRKVHRVHLEQNERERTIHFSVTDDRWLFHVSFSPNTLRWKLDEMAPVV